MDDGHLPPLAFILLRVFTAALLFWGFHKAFVKEAIDRRDIGLFLLCGLCGVAINQTFFFSGLQRTTPINASLIMTTSPILVLVVSAIVVKERITSQKLAGILIGAFGAVLLIAYGRSVSFNRQGLIGDVMVFINAASYGIYLVLVKSLMVKYHPITVVRWVFTFGLALVFPVGIGELLDVQWSTFTPVIWLAVFYVLLGTTFLAYLLNAFALREVNASVVSIYIYLQPLIATGIALLLGKDQLSPVKMGAGLAIFLGVYLVSRRRANS